MYTRATQSMYYKQNKKNCSNYKKAVDLGKRSGGGRILITFYDPCQDMWAESSATTSLSYGFDSSMVSEDSVVRDEKEIYVCVWNL